MPRARNTGKRFPPKRSYKLKGKIRTVRRNGSASIKRGFGRTYGIEVPQIVSIPKRIISKKDIRDFFGEEDFEWLKNDIADIKETIILLHKKVCLESYDKKRLEFLIDNFKLQLEAYRVKFKEEKNE